MATCCGKERVTNFCPQCGKAMNKEAGLLGLVRYLTQQLESAQRKLNEAEKQVKYCSEQLAASRTEQFWVMRLKDAEKAMSVASNRVEKWKDWQESVIKLVDGE